MKKLLKNKAFTLVELIVAMALTVLITAAAMAMMGPVQNIIKSLDKNADVDRVADTIGQYIEHKMSKASGYEIFSVEQDKFFEEDELKDIEKIKNIISSKEVSESVRVLAFIPNDDGNLHKFYDYGIISSMDNLWAKVQDNDEYCVLNDEYYLGYNYRFTVEPVTAPNYWCTYGITAYDADNNILTQTRTTSFKLLNVSLNGGTVWSEAALKNNTLISDFDSYPDLDCILLVYRIKDFGNFTA